MYLQKVEMIGFKSFAEKTVLEFLPPSNKSKGITAIVGPNGSGKSNVADALRWVLGEQSAKLLRGKKAEDVIFSGSEKRARSGFAEATIYLNNEDGKVPIEYSEVTITRRIYRDGESEYLINKTKVRLTDIQLLLAQAQFGARTYAVVGQGMADAILVASPAERKDYFDEAAGVRQFQLKRNNAVSKLDQTRENLNQADLLLAEIEPRLRSLARQVKRLEDRDRLEEELHAVSHQYYGRLWRELKAQIDYRQGAVAKLEEAWKGKEAVLQEAQAELARLAGAEETAAKQDDQLTALQSEYEKLVEEKSRLRSREMEIRSQMEIAEQVRKKTATVLPLSKIIETVGEVGTKQGTAIDQLRSAGSLDEAKATVPAFEAVRASAMTLRDRLERPAVEETAPVAHDPAVLKELEGVRAALVAIDQKTRAAQANIADYGRDERTKKSQFFQLQRGLQEKINSAHELERQLGNERVEMARLDTRREALEMEMGTELGERAEHAKQSYNPTAEGSTELWATQIQRLKYNLNLIGGIDPEVMKEYEETKSRHEYLLGQVTDLKAALADLDKVITDLDTTIKQRSEAAFRQINRDFDRFFKLLFGGGNAELVQMREEPPEEDEAKEGEISNNRILAPSGVPAKAGNQQGLKMPHGVSDQIVGIDIIACPPGKKIKNIAMLSGGERTLVSIALVCSILVSNPSPFVVLDEMDAALDENNADKYARIVAELAEQTQFIIVTHNRYTMNRANVLYGVTMREDGTSQLLSVNLDEVNTLKNQNQKQKVAV
ncbi:MAG: AAA family ATPase [Patescibacteria group bacterium]|nr:AAA family ATPase [Patescibacteria group bacterium]